MASNTRQMNNTPPVREIYDGRHQEERSRDTPNNREWNYTPAVRKIYDSRYQEERSRDTPKTYECPPVREKYDVRHQEGCSHNTSNNREWNNTPAVRKIYDGRYQEERSRDTPKTSECPPVREKYDARHQEECSHNTSNTREWNNTPAVRENYDGRYQNVCSRSTSYELIPKRRDMGTCRKNPLKTIFGSCSRSRTSCVSERRTNPSKWNSKKMCGSCCCCRTSCMTERASPESLCKEASPLDCRDVKSYTSRSFCTSPTKNCQACNLPTVKMKKNPACPNKMLVICGSDCCPTECANPPANPLFIVPSSSAMRYRKNIVTPTESYLNQRNTYHPSCGVVPRCKRPTIQNICIPTKQELCQPKANCCEPQKMYILMQRPRPKCQANPAEVCCVNQKPNRQSVCYLPTRELSAGCSDINCDSCGNYRRSRCGIENCTRCPPPRCDYRKPRSNDCIDLYNYYRLEWDRLRTRIPDECPHSRLRCKARTFDCPR